MSVAKLVCVPILVLLVGHSIAQTVPTQALPDSCNFNSVCAPVCVPRACAARQDERQCDVLIRLPFGQVINRMADPTCLQAKASQNVLYELEQKQCQRTLELEAVACVPEKAVCQAVGATCGAIKSTKTMPKEFNVLWVDSHLQNNRYEAIALERLGATILFAQDTASGIAAARARRYQVVITNFARPNEPNAGYVLIEGLRKTMLNKEAPVIIYSSVQTAQTLAEARAKGAFAQTSQPTELLDLVQRALKQ